MAQTATGVNMLKKILTNVDHLEAAQELAEARRNIRRFLKRINGRYGIQAGVIDHGLKADRLIEQLRSAMDLLEFRTLPRESPPKSVWYGSAGPFADIDREESGDNGRTG